MEILKVKLRKTPLAADVDLEQVIPWALSLSLHLASLHAS